VESYTFKGFEAFSAATLVYLAISVIITFLVDQYNIRVLQVHKGA
jgi:polar amino acid transport system permease protein